MASGIFAVLDDVTVLMDDIATMSKVAAKKTSGILGDDLAVNAEKSSGFASSRELPVLWAIIKGSLLNKIIILPIAFILSAFLPWAVTLILILGGVYLAFEGAEKIYEFVFPHAPKSNELKIDDSMTESELNTLEKERIKSAVVTDFILSVEIVIIALSTVVGQPLFKQIIVVSVIALIATIGVYGIVGLLIRMDEAGLKLIAFSKRNEGFFFSLGTLLVKALPIVIRVLSVVGTIALLLVSGGIFVHYIDFIHHLIPKFIPVILFDFLVGLVIGMSALLAFKSFKWVKQKL